MPARHVLRSRLVSSLAASSADLRLLTGPAGSGKTVACRQYAEANRGVALISVHTGETWDELSADLSAAHATAEVVIDGLDRATPAAIANALASIERDLGSTPRYLVSARSRAALGVQRYLASGSADWFDASQLAFDRDEIRALAEGCRVALSEVEIEQLLYDTDGWAIVTGWVLQEAARSAATPEAAVETWAEKHGYLLFDLLSSGADDVQRSQTYLALLGGAHTDGAESQLAELEARGYPVHRSRDHLRPYRVMSRLWPSRRDADPPLAPMKPRAGTMIITLLGQFSCTIDGRPINFLRRRDQNVLTYLAIAPGAGVTRPELMQRFWPSAAPAVASQGLRTTLSRLRRAIADAANGDAQAYLRIGARISLIPDAVTVDARRFQERLDLGIKEDALGNDERAREHYAIAAKLYAGDLYESEAVEAPFDEPAEQYRTRLRHVLKRLVELHRAARNTPAADRAAARLAAALPAGGGESAVFPRFGELMPQLA